LAEPVADHQGGQMVNDQLDAWTGTVAIEDDGVMPGG
jgi:hypothetical protein